VPVIFRTSVSYRLLNAQILTVYPSKKNIVKTSEAMQYLLEIESFKFPLPSFCRRRNDLDIGC
jgi:hypothetical protein